MKKKTKKRSQNTNSANKKFAPKQFLISSIKSIIVYVLLLLITAFLCYKINISADKYFYIVLAISILSSLVSGFSYVSKVHEKGILNGILAGIPCTVLMLILVLLYNNASLTFTTAIAALVMVLSSGVGGTLSVNIRR